MECKCEDCKCKGCPLKPECNNAMKHLKRYLRDTEVFLSKCDKCPIAEKLSRDAKKLLTEIENSGHAIV